MKILNKKGFTLVELLAVIVILAILILFALPAVISTMETARAGAFKNEVNAVVNDAQTAFSRKSFSNSPDIKPVTIGGVTYRYMCMTLKQLYTEGYSQKAQYDDETAYKGRYMIFVPTAISTTAESNNTIISIQYYNGQFTVNNMYYSETSSDKYTPSYQDISGDAEFGKCPSADPKEIPHTAASAG